MLRTEAIKHVHFKGSYAKDAMLKEILKIPPDVVICADKQDIELLQLLYPRRNIVERLAKPDPKTQYLYLYDVYDIESMTLTHRNHSAENIRVWTLATEWRDKQPPIEIAGLDFAVAHIFDNRVMGISKKYSETSQETSYA